jgi:hypothetical protein
LGQHTGQQLTNFATAPRNALTSPLPAALVCRGIDACYVVRDRNGQQLAYVYFEGSAERLQHDGDEPKTLVGVGVTGAPF